MKLNADIGESYGKWSLGNDAHIMPMIDQANIACGYHAGDALTMQETVRLAQEHQVALGAHVSYPDLQGFGRRSMHLSQKEIIAIVHAQMATLEGMAKCQGGSTSFVKPHGALYNDMMKDTGLFESIVLAIHNYHSPHELVIQALPNTSVFSDIAAKYGVKLQYEAFADRAYTPQGLLVGRDKVNAVLTEAQSLKQVEAILANRTFYSACNKPLNLTVDTICVHSDTPSALLLCEKIRSLLDAKCDEVLSI
jgi:UPF0271 protein